MNESQTMDERIWNFIDGSGTVTERSTISQLIENDTEWKMKYGELLKLHNDLGNSELEAPPMRFTKNVMEAITKLQIAPAAKSYINSRLIWGLGFFFIALIIGFLVYGFAQADWSSNGSSTLSEKLSKVDLSKFFNNTWVNAFMMINVILGLVLLDNYFSNKRKEFRKGY
jgi:hypothetical protein